MTITSKRVGALIDDAGELPRGWRQVKFGEVVRQVRVDVKPEGSGLERYVAGEHMDTDDLRIRRWGTIGDGYLGPAFHRKFVKGQVLYGSRRTYLRKVAVADFDGICANTTFVLEPADNQLLPDLLPFIMQTDAFNEHSIKQSKGSVNPYINFSDLAWYEFALPPRDEQRRIAEILWAADASSEQYAEAYRAADQLRRAVLKDVVLNGVGQIAFKSTELGQVPIHWRIMRIAEAGEVQLGRQRSPDYQTGKWTRPYLRVANVFDGYLDLTDVLVMDFDEQDFEKFRLKTGDILLNEGQSRELVGRSCIYRGEIENCCFQNTLIRFRASSELFPEYAHAYFQLAFYSGTFAQVARQTTSIAHLGADRFAGLPMPLPPTEEQCAIVDVVSQVNSACERLSRHKLQASNVKRALITRLLSGDEPRLYEGSSHV